MFPEKATSVFVDLFMRGARCWSPGVWVRLPACDWRHFTDAMHCEACIIDECMMSDSTSENHPDKLDRATTKPHRNPTYGAVEQKNRAEHNSRAGVQNTH